MIKSDSMNRKILILLALLLLFGCAQRGEPEVFRGDVVATHQTPTTKATQSASREPEETRQPPESTPNSSPEPEINQTEPPPDQGGYPITSLTPAGSTQTPAATASASLWDGIWHIWYQAANGTYFASDMTIQVAGLGMKGTASIEGIQYYFKGDIFEQGSQVKGEWHAGEIDGTFWWKLNSSGVFTGSREGRFGFCGSRAIIERPANCREINQE